MTPEKRLAAIRERHKPFDGGRIGMFCADEACDWRVNVEGGGDWPCDVAFLLERLDTAERVIEQQEEVIEEKQVDLDMLYHGMTMGKREPGGQRKRLVWVTEPS